MSSERGPSRTTYTHIGICQKRSVERQADHEARPAVVGELGVDPPAVQLDDLTGDVQAEAHARASGMSLVEALEELGAILRIYARPVVAHGDVGRLRRSGDPHLDRAFAAVLERVLDEIREDLPDTDRVDVRGQRGRRAEHDLAVRQRVPLIDLAVGE